MKMQEKLAAISAKRAGKSSKCAATARLAIVAPQDTPLSKEELDRLWFDQDVLTYIEEDRSKRLQAMFLKRVIEQVLKNACDPELYEWFNLWGRARLADTDFNVAEPI
jgi:hypothetical protein